MKSEGSAFDRNHFSISPMLNVNKRSQDQSIRGHYGSLYLILSSNIGDIKLQKLLVESQDKRNLK